MKRLLYINLIFATLLFSTGCKKGFLTDLAVNPNQPSQAPAALILPPILTGYAANVYFSPTGIGLWMGYYSISGSYSVDDNTATYYVSAASPSNWDNIYSILKNAVYIEKQAAADPNGAYSEAAAKIMKAYGFQIIVDGYGSAPYSDAFKGAENFFPKYDDGKAIYDSSIAELNNAMDLIANASTTTTNLGANDVMFGGKMDKWAKFANTLKLRFLIRQSNVISAADAKAEIAKTASVGYLAADALVNPGYLNTAGKQNPYWGAYGVDPGGSLYSDGFVYARAGGAALNFFKSRQDPRLFYVYAPDQTQPDPADPTKNISISPNTSYFFKADNNYSNYHGVFYGDRVAANKQGVKGTAGIGHGVMSAFSASVPLFTAAESNFLQAEAAFRGWTSADAQSLYLDGIKSSFEYLYTAAGDSKADADADAAGYDTTQAGTVSIKNIITQKWAALAGINSFEAWTEYRRTGFPNAADLPTSVFPGNSRHIPTKLMYPITEANTNKDNYNAAVAKGNNPQSSMIFWMK